MDRDQLEQVRRFNRLVTQRVGALETSYLAQGRPLGEARLLFEIGAGGAAARALRERLGLDSAYLSRLTRSLEAQGLVETRTDAGDGRRRWIVLTAKGRDARAAYDRLSDQLAASMLARLDPARRARLTAAMAEVERGLRAAAVEVAIESPRGADARACLAEYYRELAARFERGFDLAANPTPPADEMIPPAGAFVVARLDGAAIGCGAIARVDASRGEIKRVWTAPAARGLGVARLMLRRLEAFAREAGMTALRLDTNRALTEAHALYRAEGYREVAAFNANPYAHHWFAKDL